MQNWSLEALESLQCLERYSILRSIEEAKKLAKKVSELAIANAKGEDVSKVDVQNAIADVISGKIP